MSTIVFKHDRAGFTGELRASIESTAGAGALGAAGLGQASGLPEGQINATGDLLSLAGAAYKAAGSVPGVDPQPPTHRLTVYSQGVAILAVSFEPVETSAGVVNVNVLIARGQALAATPAQLAELNSLLAAAGDLPNVRANTIAAGVNATNAANFAAGAASAAYAAFNDANQAAAVANSAATTTLGAGNTAAAAASAATAAANSANAGAATATSATLSAQAAADLALANAGVLPRLVSGTTANPPSPNAGELAANPLIYGLRAGPGNVGWQRLLWTPNTLAGAWVLNGPASGASGDMKAADYVTGGLSVKNAAQLGGAPAALYARTDTPTTFSNSVRLGLSDTSGAWPASLIGALIPRTNDFTEIIQGDYQDEFAMIDRTPGRSVTMTMGGVAVAPASLAGLFEDNSSSISAAAGSAMYPMVIEFDCMARPIIAAANGRWRLGLTYRLSERPTGVKIENWNGTAWVTVRDRSNITPDDFLGGFLLDDSFLSDPANGYSIQKMRVTLTRTGTPLALAIQRVILYHATAEWDPWHLHRRGGEMLGDANWVNGSQPRVDGLSLADRVTLSGQTGGTIGKVVRRSGTNTWVDANVADTLTQLSGMGVKIAGNRVVVGGVAPGLSGLTPGVPYYLTGVGNLTATMPASGNVRRVGVAHSATELDLSAAEAGTGVNMALYAKVDGPSFTGNVYVGGQLSVGGFDMTLGSADQTSRGDSGPSRVMVKESGSVLTINYGGDFTGGINLAGAGGVTVTGPLKIPAPTADNHAATRAYVDSSSPGVIPRGTGGTAGRVTTRNGGTGVRTDLLPGSPIYWFEPDRVGLIDSKGRVIKQGAVGDVTGLPGFTAGKSYYLADPVGSGPNLAPFPDPLPAGFPGPSLLSETKRFYRVGSCFSDGGRLYFSMYADSIVAIADNTPITVATFEELKLDTLPYATELLASGDVIQWINYQGSANREGYLRADGDATGRPGGAAASTVTRSIAGTTKGVYYIEKNYGSDSLKRLPATPQRLGGDVLMRFQNEATQWDGTQVGIFVGGYGNLQSGGVHDITLINNGGTNVFVLNRRITFVNGAVNMTYLAEKTTAMVSTPNVWYWMRVRVNAATKDISTRVWRDGTSEPTAWDTVQTNATVQSGYSGWRSREGFTSINYFRTSPDGVVLNVVP